MSDEIQEKLGICQWFHYQDTERSLQAVDLLQDLGVRHLRFDVSWAVFYQEAGRDWYDWLFEILAPFELLPCVWHTPPSISENGKSNGPPREVESFSNFLWEIHEAYGDRFQTIELWNEPNNWIKWDAECDPDWEKFAKLIAHGAGAAKLYHKTTVLGGMSPIDGGWLRHLETHCDALAEIDEIAIHAFPGQWNEPDDIWNGWKPVFDHLGEYTRKPIWITETGFSAFDEPTEKRQLAQLDEIVRQIERVGRVYWYTLQDLPGYHDEIEYHIGGYREPLERSLGLVTTDGRKKPAWHRFKELLNS